MVSCLTATYGRHRQLSEAVTCFVDQDYTDKELVILNNHPEPLYCDLPQVRVLNEPGYPTLGDCRNRLLKEAQGEFVRTWDDDDLYLPWAISQGVENIPPDALAWKPIYSWSWHKGRSPRLAGNNYEASTTWRTDFVRRVGYKPASAGDEHRPLLDALTQERGLARKDMQGEASYVYRWGFSKHHASSLLGKYDIAKRTEYWKQGQDDTGKGQPIVPVDLSVYWEMLRCRLIQIYGPLGDAWKLPVSENRWAWNLPRVYEGVVWDNASATKALAVVAASLIAALDCQTVVEIGICKGFSSQVLGRALASNAWRDGLLVSCDKSPTTCDRAKQITRDLPITHRVLCCDSQSVDWSAECAGRPIDLGFIDGDHRYEAVTSDLANVGVLVRPGGVLCCHDYTSREPGLCKAVDEFVAAAAGDWQKFYLPERQDTRDYASMILQRTSGGKKS